MSERRGTEDTQGEAAETADDPVGAVMAVLALHSLEDKTARELKHQGKELKEVIERLTGMCDGLIQRYVHIRTSLAAHGRDCMQMLAAYAEGLEPSLKNQAHLLDLMLRVQQELLGYDLEEVRFSKECVTVFLAAAKVGSPVLTLTDGKWEGWNIKERPSLHGPLSGRGDWAVRVVCAGPDEGSTTLQISLGGKCHDDLFTRAAARQAYIGENEIVMHLAGMAVRCDGRPEVGTLRQAVADAGLDPALCNNIPDA